MSKPKCRICDGEALSHKFNVMGFGDHVMRYDKCGGCGSLLCRDPVWLNEAYANEVENADLGAPDRAKIIHRVVNTLDDAGCSCRRLLDYGSGKGIYASSLREQGFSVDEFDPNSLGCLEIMGDCYDGIMMVEVLEHLMEPVEVLAIAGRLLADEGWLLASTNLYEGQGPKWPYLAAQYGQHITFVSRKGLAVLAEREGLSSPLSFVHGALEPLQLHLMTRGSNDLGRVLFAAGFRPM